MMLQRLCTRLSLTIASSRSYYFNYYLIINYFTMEADIFNDILTLTVDKLILGINNDLPRIMNTKETRDKEGRGDSRDSAGGHSRLSQSSFISGRSRGSRDSLDFPSNFSANSNTYSKNNESSQANSIASSQQAAYKHNCTIEEWLAHNAPILMQSSAKRLDLNLNNIEQVKLTGKSVNEIAEMKKRAKNELKIYDQKFEDAYHRAPNREEKEPMRPLYIYYRMLKHALEQPGNSQPEQQPKGADMVNRMVEELVELKKRRNDLRAHLEAYQQEFTRRNNRRIRYRGDIIEVEEDYNLYKKLKEDISRLEEAMKKQIGNRDT